MIVTKQLILQFLSYCQPMVVPVTLDVYYSRVNRLRLMLNGAPLGVEPIYAWYRTLLCKHRSSNTLQAYHTTVLRFIAWAEEKELIRKGSIVVKLPKLPSPEAHRMPFTEAEYNTLIEVAGFKQFDDFWPLAIRIAWATGLRLKDISMLRWDSINREEWSINLRPSKTMRMNKRIEVPLPADLVFSMIEYRMKDTESPYVLPRMAELYTAQWRVLCAEFKKISTRAKVPEKTFHCLRHSFVSRLINDGVPPAIVASMSGHTLQQMERYIKVGITAKKQALGII